MNKSSDSSTLVPPAELVQFFDRYRRYYILGHMEPDGDCLGSQLALSAYLRSKGAETALFSPGPFSRPEVEDLAPLFQNRIPESDNTAETAVVVLDCSTPDRIGSLKEDIEGLPLCVIDHHASGNDFGDVRWVEPSASSVTMMIQRVIESRGDLPARETAAQLFFGLATDTGFFRHLDETGAEALRCASRLVDTGVSPKAAYARMYGNRPFSSRILLGRLLERCRILASGRLLYTYETLADRRELGPEARDSDILYQLLLGTRGCEAAVVIREEDEAECSAGLRALLDLDVGSIAKSFGGGGHAKAAGFSHSGRREELEKLLLPRMEAALG